MTLRKSIELAVKGDTEVEEVINTLEDQGFDLEFHRQYHDSTSHEDVHSYSIKSVEDTENHSNQEQ